MTHRTPNAGDRYRIPWRDFEECEVLELSYGGNVVEIIYIDSGERSAISLGDWQNWMGDTEPHRRA